MKNNNTNIEFNIFPLGDAALTAEFGDEISEELNDRAQMLYLQLKEQKVPGIRDIVPTYRSVTVLFDPAVIRYSRMEQLVRKTAEHMTVGTGGEHFVYEIPVCYGGTFGPDLSYVAEHAGITEEEVIRLHTAPDYRIYMLGFLPGFPYLGGLNDHIRTPRLETPRLKIPAGSVGIAGGQTGIYPMESPGGWQLIGRTPVKVYDPNRKQPVLYRAGDRLKFIPVTPAEFDRITALSQEGAFTCHVEPYRS